ncbi:hypothetical protein E2320_014456 [Naja naja]|nr:hypothetical protein E2320_014456 [Naja naja]
MGGSWYAERLFCSSQDRSSSSWKVIWRQQVMGGSWYAERLFCSSPDRSSSWKVSWGQQLGGESGSKSGYSVPSTAWKQRRNWAEAFQVLLLLQVPSLPRSDPPGAARCETGFGNPLQKAFAFRNRASEGHTCSSQALLVPTKAFCFLLLKPTKCHVQSPSLFLPGCPQDFSPRILQPASPGHWSTQNIGRGCGSSYREKARGEDK